METNDTPPIGSASQRRAGKAKKRENAVRVNARQRAVPPIARS
jgi:hypothetical protein